MLLLAIILPAVADAAGAVEIDIHGLSKHFGADRKYNERNYGAGITWIGGRHGVSAGGYRNSLDRPSAYLGYVYQSARFRRFSAGVDAGVVTGYRAVVSPMLAPRLDIHAGKRITVKIRYMPAIGGITPAVLSASIAVRVR